jgi:DNA adenine methylase
MQLTSVKPRRGLVRTPLRYPGGKTRLAGFLAHVLDRPGWRGATYVEPYAGGAGAALSLLHSGVVARVVINDLDPCMFAFWRAAVDESSAMLHLLDSAPLTIAEWERQREIYRQRDTANLLELGFATFYLNRTNRSGVMNAGVIGGKEQRGKYKIDARYNKSELRARLEWIGENASRIKVSNLDGLDVIRKYVSMKKAFSYIDPPYFAKGSFLYLNSFMERDHTALADLLRQARGARWILTYDDVPEIRRLYRGMYQGTFHLPYSAHVATRAKERMVLSDAVAALDAVMP